MKIGFYNEFRPCVIKEDGVVDAFELTSQLPGSAASGRKGSPQVLLESIISSWDTLRPRFEELARTGAVIPMDRAKLRAPVPRPGKVLCGEANYKEGVPLSPPRPLVTFFKSPDAVIGPEETVVLPNFRPTIFNHEAELGVIIGKRAKQVSQEEALSHVFGYTTAVDVSARAPEEGEAGLPGTQAAHYGKSFDTFLPIGPSITTADEVPDPNNLRVRYWVNEVLRQDYNTSDMEHSLAYMIASLSHVMTLQPGDLIMAGTNHGNLGPLQDGDWAEIEIESVGRNSHRVRDDLKRTWEPNAWSDGEYRMQVRRKDMQGAYSPGTWPFTPPVGTPPSPA